MTDYYRKYDTYLIVFIFMIIFVVVVFGYLTYWTLDRHHVLKKIKRNPFVKACAKRLKIHYPTPSPSPVPQTLPAPETSPVPPSSNAPPGSPAQSSASSDNGTIPVDDM